MDYQSFQPNPSAPQAPQQMPPVQKTNKLRFFGLVVLFVVACGFAYANFWYWQQGKSVISIVSQKIFWKPYVNEQFGFVFRYPPSFTVLESYAEDPITHAKIPEVWKEISLVRGTETSSLVKIGINNETISQWGVGCKILSSKSENVSFNNIQATKKVIEVATTSACQAERHVEYRFRNLGNTFIVSGVINNDLREVGLEGMAERIILTLKFYGAPEFQYCGGAENVKCSSGYVCRLPEIYPDAGGMCVVQATPIPKSWACFRPQYLEPYCPKVLTTAKNIKTGEVKQFPDGCLPSCWQEIQ